MNVGVGVPKKRLPEQHMMSISDERRAEHGKPRWNEHDTTNFDRKNETSTSSTTSSAWKNNLTNQNNESKIDSMKSNPLTNDIDNIHSKNSELNLDKLDSKVDKDDSKDPKELKELEKNSKDLKELQKDLKESEKNPNGLKDSDSKSLNDSDSKSLDKNSNNLTDLGPRLNNNLPSTNPLDHSIKAEDDSVPVDGLGEGNDSPLTDIATSPPFDLQLDDPFKADESSELSDLGDNSEAETDKMDFLDDDEPSDLHQLARLTEAQVGPSRKRRASDESDSRKRSRGGSSDEGEEDDQKEMSEEREKSAEPKEMSEEPKTEPKETSPELEVEPKTNIDKEEVEESDNRKIEEENENEDNEVDSKNKVDKGDLEDDANNLQESREDAPEEDQEGAEDADDVEDVEDADDVDDADDGEDGEDGEGEGEQDLTDEQRKQAIEELISIESSFAALRDKLYHDKLNLLERELQLCLEGLHPELSKIYYKINGFYQENVRLANFNLTYKLKCIDKETRATRTLIHQDFLRRIMDSKNEMITNTTALWYKINKERNEIDQLVPEYGYQAVPQIPNVTVAGSTDDDEMVPLSKKALRQNTLYEMVLQRNRINQQIGTLQGLIEFHGFPAAVSTGGIDTPNVEAFLTRATDDEIHADLREMGL